MAAIGNEPPDVEPRATAHIGEMIEVIGRLIENGHAYEAEGHVLFSVRDFDGYGALSGRSLEDMRAGARVEVAPYKRDAGDFVLWKPSSAHLPGWESPWGRGRPGWHIECSAMSWRYLGESFDIHGGGSDLIFPHHENERAQSLCAFPGSGFARVWLHNGMLQVNGEKMSKSLGNFFTLRDVLARAPAEAVRLLLLRARYRAVLDFTEAGLVEAREEMDRFYRALQRHPGVVAGAVPAGFLAALCDDVNTPAAIAELHGLAAAAMAGDAGAASGLLAAGGLLGLLQGDAVAWFQAGDDAVDVLAAIEARNEARRVRDFGRADAIRAEMAARGVLLEDGPGGTTWRRA
jgi:cysteinyl-tRNA synthetase